MSKVFLYFIMVFFACPVWASKSYVRIVTPTPVNKNMGNSLAVIRSCEDMLNPYYLKVDNWIVTNEGIKDEPEINDPTGDLTAEEIIESILASWSQRRGYSPEKIEYLRSLNSRLDRRRVSYLAFKDEGNHLSGLRLFDGSTHPLLYGAKWVESSDPETKLLPFEKDLMEQGYELPERKVEAEGGPPANLLSIGLLNIDKLFDKGVETIFRFVAQVYIDRNYNGFRYLNFGDDKALKVRNMSVYAICRRSHLKIYEAYGFTPVFYEGTETHVKTNDGLHLIHIPADVFMKRYYKEPFRPLLKASGDTWNYEVNAKEWEERVAYFQELSQRDTEFKNTKEFIDATIKLSHLHNTIVQGDLNNSLEPMLQFLDMLGAGGQVRESLNQSQFRKFFEELYLYAKAYAKLASPEDFEKNDYEDQHLLPYELMLMHKDFDSAYRLYQQLVEAGKSPRLWSPEQIKQVLQNYQHYISQALPGKSTSD